MKYKKLHYLNMILIPRISKKVGDYVCKTNKT